MGHFDSTSVLPDQHLPQVGTLSGNPVACAAGLATLSILRQNSTYQNLFERGKLLMQGLQDTFHNAGIAAKVIGEPVLFDVFFTDREVYDYRSGLNSNSQLLSEFNQLLLNHGILKGATKFYISTKHSREDIQITMAVFDQISETLKQ
jgi:glutamate-1-semialdehyde 2,1-aminomutase